MKLYKSIFAVLAVAATSGALVSCDDDLDRPPVIVPVATYEANTSIAEFKELFWNAAQNNTPETIPVNADGDSIILAGRVISSDQSGNVYQRIYVRDESGAMDFRIYGYDLNESYHMGQEVRINVTGLLVGGYGTQMQIGVWYTNPNTGSTSLGGMDKEEFIRRAQRQGLPAATDAEPYTVKISDLEAWKNDKEKLIQWQCQLVKIENVSFDGGGQEAWCNNPGQTGSTNRTLKDAEGNSITVRTNSPHRSYPKAPDLLWLSSATTTAPGSSPSWTPSQAVSTDLNSWMPPQALQAMQSSLKPSLQASANSKPSMTSSLKVCLKSGNTTPTNTLSPQPTSTKPTTLLTHGSCRPKSTSRPSQQPS